MKRALVVAAVVLALAGGGLALALRRAPAGTLLDEPASPFALEAAPPGWRAAFVDGRATLRAMRWLTPRQPGVLVAQAQTQSDRQLVTLLREGAAPVDLQVARPQGVGEGFWRLAKLEDARVQADGSVLLLYTASTGAETSLLLCVAPGEAEARWTFRGAFDRMAAGASGAVAFLYAAKGPVLRLPIAGSGKRPSPREIELPPEVAALDDLLATGPDSFLAAGPAGLASWQAGKDWTFHPGPEDRGLPCAGWRGTLARAGRAFWWQAAPGKVVEVARDGSAVEEREIAAGAEDPDLARDGRLLRLAGADPGGRLWFTLATPAVPAEADPEGAWAAYAARGLARVYRWEPAKGVLERMEWASAWTSLRPPQGVEPGAPRLDPASGALLLEGSGAAWWLPLGALPFSPVQAR